MPERSLLRLGAVAAIAGSLVAAIAGWLARASVESLSSAVALVWSAAVAEARSDVTGDCVAPGVQPATSRSSASTARTIISSPSPLD